MDNDKIKECADRIKAFYETSRRMPTYSEMLKIFRLRSKNAVFKRVAILVKRGLFEKDRSGRLLPDRLHRPARFLGFIQAGFPSPAEEELQDTMNLDEYLISNPAATYLLKVEGDSMIDAGIHPGDLVLIRRDLIPGDGDIVAARVDNEWTLKYFIKNAKGIVLKAANEKYPTIKPERELMVGGVVIANVRKYK